MNHPIPTDIELKNGTSRPSVVGIRADFANYAETCFRFFGDRGYDVGLQAQGRCSVLLHLFCRSGNSATEPSIVGHNVCLSHATVVDISRRIYEQQGSIGISFDVMWYEPMSNSLEDIAATQRGQDFQFGCSMKTQVGSRLPQFSKPQSALIKGSIDFVGINHYATYYAHKNTSNIIGVLLNDSLLDSGALTLHDPDNSLIPIKDTLKDEKRIKYHNDYLTNLLASMRLETRWVDLTSGSSISPNFSGLGPKPRPKYYSGSNLARPIITPRAKILAYINFKITLVMSNQCDGCIIKGYFVWSLLDNWEWAARFTLRFGLYLIDYNDKLKRYLKDYIQWFKNFLK
ncbi:hypothetical protein AMTRI_Chr12g234590 [Amborella trichopoda]